MDSSPMNHCLPTSGIAFIIKIRFRILSAFEDKKEVFGIWRIMRGQVKLKKYTVSVKLAVTYYEFFCKHIPDTS